MFKKLDKHNRLEVGRDITNLSCSLVMPVTYQEGQRYKWFLGLSQNFSPSRLAINHC